MAGEGVRLVERLRLGESPEPIDWNLAAALLSLRDAASSFVAAATDLVQDREKAGRWARFEVRTRLLALSCARLESEAERVERSLAAYFAVRAEDEDEDDGEPTDEVSAEPVEAADDGESSVRSELSTALEAGGMAAADATAIGAVGETARLDAAWLATSLADLLMAGPDVDAALDFCGEVEARFASSSYEVKLPGDSEGSRVIGLAEALTTAVDRAGRSR